MQIDFTDKRVLVTGGTRGIRRGAVEAFLEAGARVAVNRRTANRRRLELPHWVMARGS